MKALILATLDDLITDFLYYGRREDEELKVGDIEKAIEKNQITIDEIVSYFKEKLIERIKF